MRKILQLYLLILFTLGLSYAEEKDEVAYYREEIQLLNLFNGLELTPEQKRFIREKSAEALNIRGEYKVLFNDHNEEYLQVLREIRAVLKTGKETPPELRERFHKEEGRLKELKEEGEKKIRLLAEDVKGVLNGHQQFLLEEYKPCIIPPPGPANIGQVENPEGQTKQLERVRSMPEITYQRQKEKIAQKMIERIKKHLPKGYILDEDEEKKRILSLLTEVRLLSGIDFQLEKEGLIEEFKGKYILPKVPVDLTVKIERFFFTSHSLSLL